MNVELIYDHDCPNADGARQLLTKAFQQVGLNITWSEYCRQDKGVPDHVLIFGSPTILVDGKDVAPIESGGGNSCRLYRDSSGRTSGLPPVENVLRALKAVPGRL